MTRKSGNCGSRMISQAYVRIRKLVQNGITTNRSTSVLRREYRAIQYANGNPIRSVVAVPKSASPSVRVKTSA
jgi:hypothetical protein